MRNISLGKLLSSTATAAALFALTLTIKSIMAFSRQGPAIREQIEAHYFGYAAWSVFRLAFLAFLVAWLLAILGALVQTAFLPVKRRQWAVNFISGGLGIAIGTALQFATVLIHEPGTIMASWLYSPDHLVKAWFWINPEWLPTFKYITYSIVALSILVNTLRFLLSKYYLSAAAIFLIPLVGTISFFAFEHRHPSWRPTNHAKSPQKPNIILIGSDTLRADRFGIEGYHRKLTPYIDQLSEQGYWFSQIYTPIARTAPSLTTLLTGAWPRQTGITSNFNPDSSVHLPVTALPQILRAEGYSTGVVSDWAGGDLGKFDFGFEEIQTAPDQWNLKYLLRQGPKDLRLFLSLFTKNEISRILLPELYYLAGRPLTTEVGRDTRKMIDRFSSKEKPFFIMTFISTTHGPFGSEYPYYTLYSGRDYKGPAKFCITEVFTPEDIAKRQAQGAESFDVQQIIDLYDGAVRRFDDEVKRIVEHLKKRGIAKNTIIVIFSDHGTDLFEKGTWGQGNTVMGKDPSNRIPLLIVDPRRNENRIINSTVRALDLPPTLLELSGTDPKLLGTDGKSLVPYMDDQDTRNRSAYFATGAWLARVQGMAQDHVEVPPLMELLEIPDYKTGTLSISRAGREIIEKSRDRALRFGAAKMVRIPTNQGPKYHWVATSTSPQKSDGDIRLKYCMRTGLEIWAKAPKAYSITDCLSVAFENQHAPKKTESPSKPPALK